MESRIPWIKHPSVSAYLGNQTKGRDEDLRTPYFDKADRTAIKDEFTDWYSSREHLLDVSIADLERKEIPRIEASFSRKKPWKERKTDLARYYGPKHMSANSGQLDEAFECVRDHFRKNLKKYQLRPLSAETSFKMMKKSTNWGLRPEDQADQFLGGTKDKHQYLDDYINYSMSELMSIPAVLGWRGQPKLDGTTGNRVVFMMPHSISIEENRYFQPFLKMVQDSNASLGLFSALGPSEDVSFSVRSAIERTLIRKGQILSFDASKYDTSIHRDLIRYAYEIILDQFHLGDKFHPTVKRLVNIMCNTHMLTPDGIWLGRKHSVASGSIFTNIVDSIVQMIGRIYVDICLTGQSGRNALVFDQYQGDDGMHTYRFKVDINEYVDCWATLGITVNADKMAEFRVGENSQVFGHVDYLQKRYYVDTTGVVSEGVRSLARTLSGYISMERWHHDWNSYDYLSRSIMQLEEAKDHPLFKDFISWLVDFDELGLGIHEEGALSKAFGNPDRVLRNVNRIGFEFGKAHPKAWRRFRTIQVLEELGAVV